MHDGSITFSTALDNAQLEKELAGLDKKIERSLEKKASEPKKIEFSTNVSEIEKEFYRLQKEVKEFEGKMSKVRQLEDDAYSIYAEKRSIEDRESDEYKSLADAYERKLEEIKNIVEPYQKKMAEYEKLISSSDTAFNLAMGRTADGVVQASSVSALAEAEKQQDEYINRTLQRIDELKAKLEKLEEKGKYFGNWEYDEAYKELVLVAEAVKAQKRELAREAAYTEEMAGSAGIADERVAELGRELTLLQDRMRALKRADIGLGHVEYDDISARIAEINRELKEYKTNLLVTSEHSHFRELADSVEVADERIADLSQELVELKARKKDLETAGLGLGIQEYDEAVARIEQINQELKEYKRSLIEAAKESSSLSESPAGAIGEESSHSSVDEEYFSNVSRQAQATAERIDELKDRLDDLRGRQSDLGLAFGKKARAEYDALGNEIVVVTQRIENCQQYLDGLAESGDLAGLANGSDIAERRLESLEDELASLQERQQSLGLAFGAKDEYAALSAEIQRITDLMGRYKAVLGENIAGETIVDEVSKDAEVASQHIVDLCDELETLKARLKELEGEGIGLGYKEHDDTVTRIAEINQELKEYKQSLSDVEPHTNRMSRANSKMTAMMGKLSSLMQSSNSAALQGMGAALGAIAPQATLALGALKQLKAIADKAFEKMAEHMRSFLGAVSKGAEALKKFGKAAVKAFQLATAGILELLDRVNVFPKMFSSTGKSLKKLGQMIRRVFVFSVITSGLRAVRTQMTAYLNVNAQFSTALRQLKGVLLTAFQPIYDVVVPALVTLMNVLSRVIAAVTQFTAVLFGTTAKQAQKNAKDLYAQANATQAAGSAAEEAALQLASFDEINKLEGNKSAGGGGAAADTGPLFDWEYEDTPFPDWGEAFSAFLDKILGNIPKLREAFKDFADWLNGLTKKLYDMFTFPGVLDKVKRIGRELAEALNDLVNWIDWYQLGQALGAGLNLALNFLTSFLYAFDWMNLGRKLAECVNGLVSEIDWYEFGRLLWSGFKIGLEMLAGFIVGLDMPQLADAASNIVIGFFTEMKNTIQHIPWGDIGRQIAEFLVNLDWYGMLSSVTSAIAVGLMAAVAAVRGFLDRIVPELGRIAREIVQALIEFFRDKVDWAELARTIGDGIAAALHFIAALLDPELFYETGKAIGDFFINLQWIEIFGGLTEALANGINSAIAALKGFLESVKPHLKEIANGLAEKINQFVRNVDWAELGRTISDGIEAALDFMIELMSQIDWDAIGQAIVDFLSNIDWDTLLSKWGTLMGQFINAKLKSVDLSGAADIGLNIVSGIAKGMWNKFQESGGVLGWLKSLLVDPIIDGVKNLFGIHSPSTVFAEIGRFLIDGLLNGVSEAWHAITEFFGVKVDALKQDFADAWENIKTTAGEKWTAIKEALGSKWDEIKTGAQTKFDEVKQKVIEAWDKVKEDTPKKWEEIKTSLVTAWESVKTSAGEKFGEVKQNIIDKMGELKDHDWKSIGSTIMNGIWNGLKSIWDSVTGWARGAADWLGSIFAEARSAMSGAGSSAQKYASSGRMAVRAAAYSMPEISAAQIPALAKGAVIPPNREFLAVLGDQHNGNNLEGPESLFRQIIRDENGALITVLQAILAAVKEGKELSIDGATFAKLVYGSYNKESGRVGVRLAEVRG